MADGATCTFNNGIGHGYCYNSACKLASCGDYILDPSEACDDGNTLPFDGCNAECSSRFTKMQTPTANTLTAVWASPNDPYVVAVGFGGTVIVYDGTAWTIAAVGNTGLMFNSVWGSSVSDLYLGGPFGVAHVVPNSAPTFALTTTDVRAVWGADATTVFAGGQIAGGSAAVWRGSGTTWTSITIPATCANASNSQLVALWGTSPNDVYITLYNGASPPASAVLCHYDGTTLRPVDTMTGGSITGDATEVYALGGVFGGSATINVFTGKSPTLSGTIVIPGPATSIGVTDSTELLAIGGSSVQSGGFLLRMDRATRSWTNLVVPSENGLLGVASRNPNDVFVVGVSGTVLH
jgi:cysteine-rich repeat protein